MRKLNQLFTAAALATVLVAGSVFANDTSVTKEVQPAVPTQKDDIDIQKISEAFGHFIGRNLSSPGIQFDVESIVKGIRNGASGQPAPMSDQEYELAMTKLQEKAYERIAADNLTSANAFMEKNAGSAGVHVIEEGKLQYSTIEEGKGNEVQEHSSPMIHYTGKYLDGTVFGSSEEVGGPITIPLDQTIPGFSKGLLGMKEGEKRRLYIHPDLGYGTLGNLPPNALLIFDIEIVKANSAEAEQTNLGDLEEGDDDDSDSLAFADDDDSSMEEDSTDDDFDELMDQINDPASPNKD